MSGQDVESTTIVYTLTASEYQTAVTNTLKELGCTAAELHAQAACGRFTNGQTRKAWLAFGNQIDDEGNYLGSD